MIAAVLLAVGALLFAMVTHEAAHAVVLRRLGIRLEEVGLGMPFPPRLVLRPRRVPFQVSLSPWLLGAYVKPHTDDITKLEALSFRAKARYFGAGCSVNLVVGGFLLGAGALAGGRYVLGAVTLAAAVAIAFRPQQFAVFVAPALGLAVLCGLLFTVFFQPSGLGGAGTAAVEATQFTDSPIHVAQFVGAISASLGILNLAPVFPLDGGKVVDAFAAGRNWGRTRRLMQSLGTAFVLTMVTVSLFTDFSHLF